MLQDTRLPQDIHSSPTRALGHCSAEQPCQYQDGVARVLERQANDINTRVVLARELQDLVIRTLGQQF